jgi:hypothetical protein
VPRRLRQSHDQVRGRARADAAPFGRITAQDVTATATERLLDRMVAEQVQGTSDSTGA